MTATAAAPAATWTVTQAVEIGVHVLRGQVPVAGPVAAAHLAWQLTQAGAVVLTAPATAGGAR